MVTTLPPPPPIEISTGFVFMPWVIIGIFALIFAFSCMAIAKAKGYNPASWWFIGFVLGIIGLIILACFPSKLKESRSQ